MLTKMTARQARDKFTDLLGSVYYGKEPIAVEKKGRVFAVVIHPQEYEELKKAAKSRFFEAVEAIQKDNKVKSPTKVLQEVTNATEKIRKARYGFRS